MELLWLFFLLLGVALLFDPSFWLSVLAYPYIRQLRKQLHADKQPLKPLLHQAAIHTEPNVRKLARRIIILHLIAGGVVLLGLLFILERCYFNLPFFNAIGVCEKSAYSSYLLLIPLGLGIYVLYFLWDFLQLFKETAAQ